MPVCCSVVQVVFRLAVTFVFLRGWYKFGCFALQAPTRVRITISVPFVLSLFGRFADAVCLFFSSFLLGTGETQAFVVWVSPCVSSSRPSTTPSIRTPKLLVTYTKVLPSSCLFYRRSRGLFFCCFLPPCLVRLFCGLVVGGWCRAVLAVSGLSLSILPIVSACKSIIHNVLSARGRGTTIPHPTYDHNHYGHGNRTVTLCLVVFPPFRRGKCCPFFFFCVWFGVFCFLLLFPS